MVGLVLVFLRIVLVAVMVVHTIRKAESEVRLLQALLFGCSRCTMLEQEQKLAFVLTLV